MDSPAPETISCVLVTQDSFTDVCVNPDLPDPAYVHRVLGTDAVTIVGSINGTGLPGSVVVMACMHKVNGDEAERVDPSKFPDGLGFLDERDLAAPMLITRTVPIPGSDCVKPADVTVAMLC